MTKLELFDECRRLAPDFALVWSRNKSGQPEVHVTCTLRGLHYVIAHTPSGEATEDAECSAMHGALDAMQLLGPTFAEEGSGT